MGNKRLFTLRLKYFAHSFQFEMQILTKKIRLKPLGSIHYTGVSVLFNNETPASQRQNTEIECYVLCSRYNICPSICLHAYMYAMATL